MIQYMSGITVLIFCCISLVTSRSSLLDDALNHNYVIDDVLNTLNKKANETMERNHELFCNRRTYKTDLAIGYEGCASYVVEQGFCVGQCSSIYLPGQGGGAVACSMCEATKRRIKTVKLHCQTGVRIVDIPIVEECGCKACKVNNVIPEPPWKKRKTKQKKNKNKNKKSTKRNNKNRKSRRRPKNKKKKRKLRDKRKLRQQRKQMRLMLLKAEQAEKQEKRAAEKHKQVFTYDDLMKMAYSWT